MRRQYCRRIFIAKIEHKIAHMTAWRTHNKTTKRS